MWLVIVRVGGHNRYIVDVISVSSHLGFSESRYQTDCYLLFVSHRNEQYKSEGESKSNDISFFMRKRYIYI